MSRSPQDESVEPQARTGALTRRTALATAGAGGVAAAAGLATPGPASAARRGRPRRSRADVIGEIVQEGTALTGHGYLTRARGVKQDDLFDGAFDETGARVTWMATATLDQRFVRGNMIVVVAPGTLDVFLDDAGADFAAPGTFADGARIARFTARFENVLSITAPDQAIAQITGDLRQTAAPRFTLGGRRRRLGVRGLLLHLTATGPGRRLDPALPRAVFDVAGRLDDAG